MKCEICNIDMDIAVGNYRFRTKELGEIQVPLVSYFLCRKCGMKSLEGPQAQKVYTYIRTSVEDEIEKLPIGDFVSASQAAAILDLSKQAFSKNSRIKRGFIYFKELDAKRYYFLPSVLEFKKCRDGRVLLSDYCLQYSPKNMAKKSPIRATELVTSLWNNVGAITSKISAGISASNVTMPIPIQSQNPTVVMPA